MFKRLFWLSVGLIAGVWASFRFRRRVQETVDRLLPERIATDVTTKVRSLGTDLRDAAREGRATMKEREASLRAELIDQ